MIIMTDTPDSTIGSVQIYLIKETHKSIEYDTMILSSPFKSRE